MTRPTFRLGLVGCGRLAESGYLPAIAGRTDVSVAAVADPDDARREAFATRVATLGRGTPTTHAGARDLLGAAEVDALIVASPVSAHLDDARAGAEAGVPVLVEKPPAVDAAGAEALAALDPTPWVGFNRRFDPGARALRDQLAGRSGALRLRLDLSYRRPSWGAHQVRDDVALDLGPHLVDWARWISGRDALEVIAADLAHDRARVLLRLDGATAEITAAGDRLHHELVEVADAHGRTIGRHRLGGLVPAVLGRIRPAKGPGPLVTTLVGQLDALVTVLRGGTSPDLGTAHDGWSAMAIIDAARACADSGVPIPVPRPQEP